MWVKYLNYLSIHLCDPTDCSPPCSSVHEILQVRILEWVDIPFSRGSSRLRDWTRVSCIAARFFTSWATRESHLSISDLSFHLSVIQFIYQSFTYSFVYHPSNCPSIRSLYLSIIYSPYLCIYNWCIFYPSSIYLRSIHLSTVYVSVSIHPSNCPSTHCIYQSSIHLIYYLYIYIIYISISIYIFSIHLSII